MIKLGVEGKNEMEWTGNLEDLDKASVCSVSDGFPAKKVSEHGNLILLECADVGGEGRRDVFIQFVRLKHPRCTLFNGYGGDECLGICVRASDTNTCITATPIRMMVGVCFMFTQCRGGHGVILEGRPVNCAIDGIWLFHERVRLGKGCGKDRGGGECSEVCGHGRMVGSK